MEARAGSAGEVGSGDSISADVVEVAVVVVAQGRGERERPEAQPLILEDVAGRIDSLILIRVTERARNAALGEFLFLPVDSERQPVSFRLGKRQAGLVVEPQLLGGRRAERRAVAEVLIRGLQTRDAEAVSPTILEERGGRRRTQIILRGVRSSVRVRRQPRRDEVDAIVISHRVRVPREKFDPSPLGQLSPGIEIQGRIAVAVVLIAVPRDVGAVRIQVGDAGVDVVDGARGCQAPAHVGRAEATRLQVAVRAERLAASRRNQVDDARQRVAAPQGALRPAYDLDALDPGHQKLIELELVTESRIVRFDPVDQDHDLVRLRATDTKLRLRTERTGTADREARDVAQRVGHIDDLPVVEVRTTDDGIGTADARGGNRCTRSRHENILEDVGGLLRSNRRCQDNKGKKEKFILHEPILWTLSPERQIKADRGTAG